MFPLFISLWALRVVSKVSFENPAQCPLSQGKHREGSRFARAWPERRKSRCTWDWEWGFEPGELVQFQAPIYHSPEQVTYTLQTSTSSSVKLMHHSLYKYLLSSYYGRALSIPDLREAAMNKRQKSLLSWGLPSRGVWKTNKTHK